VTVPALALALGLLIGLSIGLGRARKWRRRHARVTAKFTECRILLDDARRNKRSHQSRAKRARRELRRLTSRDVYRVAMDAVPAPILRRPLHDPDGGRRGD